MARPSKLTPKVRERIVESIRAGAYAEQAARAVGIAPSTYYDWLRRGEAGEPTFSEFSDALRAGEAEAEIAAVATIREAAQAGDWRAAAHSGARSWSGIVDGGGGLVPLFEGSFTPRGQLGWRPCMRNGSCL